DAFANDLLPVSILPLVAQLFLGPPVRPETPEKGHEGAVRVPGRALPPGMRLAEQLRRHLQVVKRMARWQAVVLAEQLKDTEIGLGLHEEQPLVFRHGRRLWRMAAPSRD